MMVVKRGFKTPPLL